MFKPSLVLLCLTLSGATAFAKVTIYKQWHLQPKVDTTDIEKSKSLPQFVNQLAIYEDILKRTKALKTFVVVSEGCEGEIDERFKPRFHNWDYFSLNSLKAKSSSKFKDALTLIPLKIEVLKPAQSQTVCGDNLQLIKQHQLEMSNLRAYLGYYSRLKQFKEKKDKASYERFAKSLLEKEKNKKQDAVLLAKAKAKEALKKIKDLFSSRNDEFIKTLMKYPKQKRFLVIGGEHADDIEAKLKALKQEVLVVTPKGYPTEQSPIAEIEKLLETL